MGQSLEQYPNQDSYQLHLSYLLEETEGATWRPKLKECPIGRALLRTQRTTQVKILLAALARRLWHLAGRTPKHLAKLYLLNDICRSILRRKLPFQGEQLEAMLNLVSEPTAATDLEKLILRQLEWQPPLTLCEREALTKFKRILVHNQQHRAVKRANDLLSAAQPVTASTDAQKWRRILAHLRRVPAKLSLRWRKKAKALLLDFGEESVTTRLLPWFSRDKNKLLRTEERFCRGLIAACGELDNPRVVEFLDEIVVWSFRHIQGHGPRAPRLGHVAIKALGRMATVESFTHLLALESSSPYERLQQWVQKAQKSSARYQGVSLVSLRVNGFLEPPTGSPLGKRLARGFCLKLEGLLRSGEWLPHKVWSERAKHSNIWTELADSLVWESPSDMTLGLPDSGAGEAIRLWHPSEHPIDKAVWKRLVEKQSIQQVHRDIFAEAPVKASPPLDQYRFGAMARRRGWEYKMVGRHLATTQATLKLKQTFEIKARRAAPDGPFYKNGLAKFVVLSTPNWRDLSARHLSELARDWRLFLTAKKNRRGD